MFVPRALRPGLGDLVALADVHLPAAREEEKKIVRRGGEYALYIVLLARGHAAHTLSRRGSARGTRRRGTLDVAVVRKREDALFLGDEIFHVDLVFHVLNFGLAVVAVLVGNGEKLVLQNALELFGILEQGDEIRDLLFQLVIFILQFLAVQSLQRLQTHVENGLRLHIVQPEALP